MRRFRVLGALAGWAVVAFAATIGAAPSSADEPAFERDVRPIFKARCFLCHGEEEPHKGALDLRLRHLIVRGGESGPAIVPGKPAESLLFQKIRDGEMPEKAKKLGPAELAVIERWIAAGAKTARAEPERPPTIDVSEEERRHWSFQPVLRPPVPATPAAVGFSRTAVDAFVGAKLSENQLAPSMEADRRTLARRAYFDLLGLPPAPEEIDAFLSDNGPDAFERLTDRLISAPQYGERWGRHWLDVAGYAESDGFTEEDLPRPYAYKYRDYVIRSLNRDKPFDQFIQEQLAGDELIRQPFDPLDAKSVEQLTATGFLRMAPDGTQTSANDPAGRNEVVAETIKIVSTSLLGLSVGCARCHDHRYDPIPQVDYYRLRAVFDPAFDWQHWRRPSERLVSLQSPADRQKASQIEADAVKLDQAIAQKQHDMLEKVFERELAKVPEAERDAVKNARNTAAEKRAPVQVALLKKYPSANVHGQLDLYDPEGFKQVQAEQQRIAQLRATKPAEDFVAVLSEVAGPAAESYVFARGNHERPKQQVTPGELTVLATSRPTADLPAKDPALPTTGRRLAYARMLTDGQHPLVARVLANRVWMNHFGRGIVATPADFGVQGERPTHGELLDWLASELVSGGWELKRMHRLIVNSATYRQSSHRDPTKDRVDPDNKWYSRTNMRRLDAEAVRDALVAAAGPIGSTMFGPSVPVGEDLDGQVVIGREQRDANGTLIAAPTSLGENETRRSIYIQVRRKQLLSMLDAFDLPPMTPNCEARRTSTVAPQALMFMNNGFVVAQAERIADRLRRDLPGDARRQIDRAWRLLFGISPSQANIDAALAFLAEQTEYYRANPPLPQVDGQRLSLANYCQTLLATNQFLYVD